MLLKNPSPHASPTALSAPPAQAALLSLHSAIEFGDLWASVQNLFETIVPHDTLVMSVNYLDWRREASTRRLSSLHSRRPHGEEADRLVAQEGPGFFQPFLDAHQKIPAYQHSEVVADPRKINRSRYYRRYMHHFGWRYSAHLLFWGGHGVDTSFALRRRGDQGDFTPQEMAALRAVHPHIGVAFDRMRTFEQERQRRRLLESFYRVKPEAVLFLDWNLQPIYASQDALELCAAWNLGPKQARSFTAQAVFAIPPEIAAACAELKTVQQQLPAADEDAALPLRRVVAGRGDFEALVSFRREKGSTLTKPIFVVRLRPGEETLAPPKGGPPDLAPGNARLMHQLTPAERELAMLVCAGLTNKEIARQLNKTEGSVKVQLSGVFHKLRVRSRTQLMVALR